MNVRMNTSDLSQQKFGHAFMGFEKNNEKYPLAGLCSKMYKNLKKIKLNKK